MGADFNVEACTKAFILTHMFESKRDRKTSFVLDTVLITLCEKLITMASSTVIQNTDDKST